jgi:UV DNA damage endonuclease
MYQKKIGYACVLESMPYKTSRSFILKNFSEINFYNATKGNLDDLLKILKWNKTKNIYMFRISSDIIPFGSHIVNNIEWWNIFKDQLTSIGVYIKENNMRVSMHPGQYTVLNSPNAEVAKRSIDEIEYHTKFLDSLGLDYTNKIVLHIGGVYDNKIDAINRFIENFQQLSTSSKKRLVVENDDKSYTIEDVLYVSDKINVPVVFDNLHDKLNPSSLDFTEIIRRVIKTWKSIDGKIKLHYSDQDESKKGGAHSKFVNLKNFLSYLNRIQDIDADIMLEVKDKEISAIKCINATTDDLALSVKTSEWAKYKYLLMEKNYSFYKIGKELIQQDESITSFYIFIDDCLNAPFDQTNYTNTILHVFGYLKDKVTSKEKDTFNNLLNDIENNITNTKNYLLRLSKKYNIEYLFNSYYFLY